MQVRKSTVHSPQSNVSAAALAKAKVGLLSRIHSARPRATRLMPLILLVAVLFALLMPGLAMAQANSVPAAGAPASAAPPSPWVSLIPLAVPVLIMVLKMLIPNIPGVALPIIAPLLGAAADIVLHYAGASTLGPTWGAVLGSAGVGLREIYDQVKQSVTTPAAATAK